MQKVARQVYEHLLRGQPDVKTVLLAKSDTMFGTLQLGLLLHDAPGDADIIQCLAERSNTLAFSDKRLTALADVHYFKTFYENCTEETLVGMVLPAAQVACRRQDTFIKNVVFLVQSLRIQVSLEAAKQLIPELLSQENFVKEDANVTALLTSVCQKLDKGSIEAFEEVILRNFLLRAATEAISDTTVPFENKVGLLSASFDCIQALG